MATLAEEEWTGAKAKSMKRMQTDRAIRSWALSLWIIYRQAFRADVPRQPKPQSPFVRFADMAREAVLRTIRSARNSATADVIVAESGTDAEAHRALAHLTAARLASFVKRHRRQLEDLAERHRPERQRPERHRQVSAGVKRGNRGADSKGPRSTRKEI